MSCRQVELKDAVRSRAEKEIGQQGLKALVICGVYGTTESRALIQSVFGLEETESDIVLQGIRTHAMPLGANETA
jgi:hypothetical protein